jgi:hypothetical protein
MQERLPMPKHLLVLLLALAGLAVCATAASAHSSAGRDRDHDGLSDRAEIHRYHTNPRRRDTDRDGLSDRAEVKRYHTNPRRRDTDHDGLSDRAEVKRYHTNPRRRDTDHDGFSDAKEVAAGTNPRNAASHPAAASAPPATGSTPAPAPAASGFPNPSTTGVPAGWTPAQTRSTDLTVRTAGAVVEDVLLTNGADLYIDAPNVTVRRVKLDGGGIDNTHGGGCGNGLVIEDVTIDRGNGETNGGEGVISAGGYTARRVAVLGRSEGFRSGGEGAGCTASTIQDSFIGIQPPDGGCGDWHGDGIQGYQSTGLTIRNVTIDFEQGNCGGTAGFFYPGGEDGTPEAFADIDGLLIKGGPYSFRMGTRGAVRDLRIVNNSWDYGPVLITDTGCGPITAWDAQVVEVDSAFQPTRTVRSLSCR